MKVIDLMQKLSNGEIIKDFKVNGVIYLIDDKNIICEADGREVSWFIDEGWLNEEVEVIEEDEKIEKIDLSEWGEIVYKEDWEMLAKDFNRNCNLFVNKINEIIDKLEN